jgi:hypothetical protein
MTSPLKVYIGWDSHEPLAFQVLCHSILRRASKPVTIIPLVRGHLKGIYDRGPDGTTEFSLTRFLVPYLSDYEGMSLFLDCDMLMRTDVYRIFAELGPYRPAVSVCQHDYVPKESQKATGQQTAYPKKNWSSVMLFDNTQCHALTPDYVNTATPKALHRFEWVGQEQMIGRLPLEWNWLVGEYPENTAALNLHYTLGTPCFKDYQRCDHADLWWDEYRHMNTPFDVLTPYEPSVTFAGYRQIPKMERSR